MSYNRLKNSIALSAALLVVLFSILGAQVEAKTTRVTFENGMEVIFKENHSSPMITSIVFVRAGAKYENDFNNGVTHLLEHLLFNGTKNRSREEISEGIKNHGGYINAFTRKDLTGYLVLMPKEYIDYGIEVQADQLFNSIFVDEEVDKERKIVIEEIQKDNDNPANLAEYFFNAKSMAGSAYERPVLGYKNIIATIPREKIIEYWKQYYAPNNMISLVIGDFDTEEMIEKYRSVFGVIPPGNTPSPPVISYFPPFEKKVYRRAGNTKTTYISMSIDAPHYTDPDYYSFDLLADYLSSDELSPFAKVLVDADGKPLYQNYSASLETAEEFSRLIISVETDDVKKADAIIAGVEKVLGDFRDYAPEAKVLNGLVVSKKADEIYMEEKLHYYGFIIAPRLVATGWDFMESYLDAISTVNPTMMVRSTDRWFKNVNYIATVFYPRQEDHEAAAKVEHTTYRKQTLDNGLTIVVKSNPDSRVFALNVIGKNRTASEPNGKTGITDFVNRLIKKGTTTYPVEELSEHLVSIGANVTVNDNPWIPYDDFYTTRQFAFMKFETIDEFTDDGLALFADMIRHPAFDSAAIEDVRGVLMGVLGKNSGSTLDMCRDLFFATMFKGQPYAKSIYGTPQTIASITREDLIDYHRTFYSPGNMIITIGTNMDADSTMTKVAAAFANMAPVAPAAVTPEAPKQAPGVQYAHRDMDKEQVYIYLGNLLPGADSPDAPALRVAASVLSARLYLNLREKQGLAYSVGAGTTFDRNVGWFVCRMGTGAANYQIARDGILAEITRFKEEGPTSEELETAKNSIWGTTLTRRLSRINQAYYMGVDEYLGLGYDYETRFVPAVRAVTAEDVKRVANTYFDTANYVLTTVGNI